MGGTRRGCSTEINGTTSTAELRRAIEASGFGRCCCVFAFDLGCGENANGTAASRSGPGRRYKSAGSNGRIEQRAGDSHFTGEVSGEGEVISRVGDDLDDRPKRSVGSDGQSNLGRTAGNSSFSHLAGAAVGDESDDEEYCEEDGSNHEHHEAKS